MNYKVQGDTIVTHVTNFLFQGHLLSLGLTLLINHALFVNLQTEKLNLFHRITLESLDIRV